MHIISVRMKILQFLFCRLFAEVPRIVPRLILEVRYDFEVTLLKCDIEKTNDSQYLVGTETSCYGNSVKQFRVVINFRFSKPSSPSSLVLSFLEYLNAVKVSFSGR